MILPYLTHFLDSFADIVRLATGRLKPPNLYLATVQKMGVTSYDAIGRKSQGVLYGQKLTTPHLIGVHLIAARWCCA
jgi:hypothetical protein